MARTAVRSVRVSQVEMTELVLPNDTNRLGNLLGGRLMHWIDIAAAIATARHTNRVCVTASVDELHFHHPVKQGEVVVLRASVNRVFGPPSRSASTSPPRTRSPATASTRTRPT